MSNLIPPEKRDIQPIALEEEMKRSYLDYAMSVIVSRALPDVRDGLKPVHRRILFTMKQGGYDSSKPFKKSARIVGDVMGQYHPHGDVALYDAMVRMAQDFSMRLPLINGQGNFGSMDGDPPAAMRYTEARLMKVAETLLADIDKETVDFRPNYDDTQMEPVVLPARFPNLLVNGAGGIAVGMATNIPPHNLGELLDACLALIDRPDLSTEDLMEYVKGPDFPTGGLIMGRKGIHSAFTTGRGSVIMRCRSHIEDMRKDRQAIVVTEIPYQVNKAKLLERIAEIVRDKIIEEISDLRDESDRDGVRVVIELKRDIIPDVVLNKLYKHTPLQTSFGVNMLALDNGRPGLMNLREILVAFLRFREDVITRRTLYLLNKARDRAHIMLGLGVAVANLEEIITLIRKSPDPQTARAALMEKDWPAHDIAPLITLVDEPDHPLLKGDMYRLSEAQSKAILDLRLHRLTGLERDKVKQDLHQIAEEILDYLETLRDRGKLQQIMRDEFKEIADSFATPRRSEICDEAHDIDLEDFIQREDMVVTISHSGYVKRVPLSSYRAQRRGGKGRTGMRTKETDFVTSLFIANTHTPLLIFSSKGIAYQLKTYLLPNEKPQSRGKAIVNLLPFAKDEKIATVMPLSEDEKDWENLTVVFATASGQVRRNRLSDFTQINKAGKIAMKLTPGDSLVGVQVCHDNQDIFLTTRLGKAIRFAVSELRIFNSRASTGVRGIKLAPKDRVISLSVLAHIEASPEEKRSYLKQSAAARRSEGVDTLDNGEDQGQEVDLSPARYAELAAGEEWLLTVSEQGFGKLTSSYAYRVTGRGGHGIWNMDMADRNKAITASFPVTREQEIIMASDGGHVMRCGVNDIRFAQRQTMGVTVFRMGKGEKLVAVAAIQEDANEEDADAADTHTLL